MALPLAARRAVVELMLVQVVAAAAVEEVAILQKQ